MTASLETLVIAAYVFATSVSIPRPGPAGKITDHELIALAVAQAATGLCSDRQFLGMIDRRLPGWFPHLPDQSQYNRRLRRLAPWIATVQLQVAEVICEGQIRLVDGTLIACANYPGCAAKSEFAGHASYGYCPSKSLFVWGMRLVLIADIKGTPVGYDLVGPKTGQERESAWELACAQPNSLLFADGGFWGAEYERAMSLIDVSLITPDKHKLGARPPAEIAKARIRLVVESVFSNLKGQMRLDHHLAKTLAGLVQRIAQRLLALTLAMLINLLTGRPPRALAAYDGRKTHIKPLDGRPPDDSPGAMAAADCVNPRVSRWPGEAARCLATRAPNRAEALPAPPRNYRRPVMKGAAALRPASRVDCCSDSSDSAAGGRAKQYARTAPLPDNCQELWMRR